IPIAVIIGLSLTLWSGIYILKKEVQHWHELLQAETKQNFSQFSKKWGEVENTSVAINQLFVGSEHVTAREFSDAARAVIQNSSVVQSVYYFPLLQGGNSKYTLPYTYPKNSQNHQIQSKLEKKMKDVFTSSHYIQAFLFRLEGVEQQLFAARKLGNSGEYGVLISQVDIAQFASQGGVNGSVSFQLEALNHLGEQVVKYQRTSSQGYAHEIYTSKADWSGGTWRFTWGFPDDIFGGVQWLAGTLVLISGILMTLMFSWFIWRQQNTADTIQQQVVERTNQLEQASRRFRLITDNAYDLIAITSIEGNLEYVNSAYHRVLGYSREELRGQPFSDFVHEKDLASLQTSLSGVSKGRNAIEFTLRIRHKNGHWLYVEAVAKGLHDTDWTVKNVVIHCRDVTSRKQFADDLARSEQRFRDFADSSADWLWEVDEKLRFTYVSPGVSSVLGYETAEMIGHMQFEALFDRESDPTRDLIETRVQRHQAYRDIEFWTRSKEGERICLRISGVPVLDELQNFSGYRGVATNITASKIDRDNMYRLATTDHLTGLLNRRRFMEELERSVSLARRHKTEGVLMFIDLDRFKEINDTHGHEAGDDILRGVTDILKKSFRSTDIVARLGGDEFAIIMHNIDPEGAQEKVQEVIERINAFEVTYKEARLSVTMSIGMITYPQEDKDGDALTMAADLAMYRAKDMGRNRVYIDDASETADNIDSVRSQLKWVKRLRTCLETSDFEMHFQPIVPSRKRQRPLFEALLRIYDEEGQIGSPAIYIDAAEHFGLIQQLDLSVVERCFQTQHKLQEQGIDVDFSINLSSRSLGDKDVMGRIHNLLDEYTINPNHIMFEVTETMAIHDPSAFRELGEIHAFITELRRMGFRFAIDDFGAGFSSFNYIRQLPVDVVKIDGSFVKDLEHSRDDRYFIESMVMLCKGLGIQTIAEFVENENIVLALEDIGVDYAQGWHLGKPEPDVADLHTRFSGKTCSDFIASQPKNSKKSPKKTVKKSSKTPAKASKKGGATKKSGNVKKVAV
ncbi:MAG: EAL domain-containing protein, partial [Alphaproteobacteria bacterium]|nr:EAL domain-containing protein [Alphaproteobacteria bacterium]